jgi:tetratricopeptide (TPR) repeat protein
MCALGLLPEKLTPADDLRETLRQCELEIVALKGSSADAIGLLKLMDRAQSLFDQLQAKEIDLRAERSRWETIEEVRHRRQQALKRTAVRAIAVLLILVIAGLIYQHFLAPDPLTKQTLLLTERAEQAIQEGHLEEALAEYEVLRELTPDDPEVFLHLGVLYETLARDADAAQAYARAHALLDSQEDLFLQWGMIYLDVGQWESARARVEAALALNPESAQGYFILASSYEAQGQITAAVDALQQAAELAYAQGDDTLYVLIKLRLGALMGSGKVDPQKQISPDSKT